MIFKIIDYGYRNVEDSIIELVVEDDCGNKFKGLLKLETAINGGTSK